MLTIIIGPNGSGKSLFAMHLLLKELLTTRRQIVTTLAVNLSALRELVNHRGGGFAADPFHRITRLVDADELGIFWRFRGHLHSDPTVFPNRLTVLGPFGDPTWQGYTDTGVCYFLDEAQVAFGARGWTARRKAKQGEERSRGQEFTDYQTQHRKVGDDVIAITPASSLLDAQFRVLSGECIVLQNWYRMKIKGFKPPPRIRWQSFTNCPPGQGEPCLASGSIYIDVKSLAGCYDTAAGVGYVGTQADTKRDVKGIPWWLIPAALLVVGFFVWRGLGYGMRYASNRGSHLLEGRSQPAPPKTERVETNSVTTIVGGGHPSAPDPKEISKIELEEEKPKAVSWGSTGSAACVVLDNGLTIQGTQLVEFWDSVLLDGQKFLKAPKSDPTERERSNDRRPPPSIQQTPARNPTPSMFRR